MKLHDTLSLITGNRTADLLVAYEDTFSGKGNHASQLSLEKKCIRIEDWAKDHGLELWRDWEHIDRSGNPGRGIPILAGGWKDAYNLKGRTDKEILSYAKDKFPQKDFSTIHECCAWFMNDWLWARLKTEVGLTQEVHHDR